MIVKVKELHCIKDAKYKQHVLDVYAMAKAYPTRTETHEQLDRLNYNINHNLVTTNNALSAIPYEDSDNVVLAELSMLNDGRSYRVKRIFHKGMYHYADIEELGVEQYK